MEPTVISFFSDLLKMNEELTKERDQLLITMEGLREKLNKAVITQQEIEAQRDSALENISQVTKLNRWTAKCKLLCQSNTITRNRK